MAVKYRSYREGQEQIAGAVALPAPVYCSCSCLLVSGVELENFSSLRRGQHRVVGLAVALRNDLHVILCLVVGRHAIVLVNSALTCIVTSQRELDVP